MVICRRHDRAAAPAADHPAPPGPEPGGRHSRCAPGWKDDLGAGVRRAPGPPGHDLRSRALPRPCAPRGRRARAPRPEGDRCPRRNPAASRPVSQPARPRGPPADPGAVPRARERLAGAPPPELGVAGRAHRVSRALGAHARRGGDREPRSPVVARRVPALVCGAFARRQSGLARRFHSHLSRARCPESRGPHPVSDARAFLGHARPLPRADLERLGVRTFLRRLASRDAALPRCPAVDVHGPGSPSLDGQPPQAPGKVAEGLRP